MSITRQEFDNVRDEVRRAAEALKLVTAERDALREVLRDVTEERGLLPHLRKLLTALAQTQAELKKVGFAFMYGGTAANETYVASVRKYLDGAVRQLDALVRQDPIAPLRKPEPFIGPAQACVVCGALAGSPCRDRQHGAAWAYHDVCGRLMRGAVCPNCGTEPPSDSVHLVTLPAGAEYAEPEDGPWNATPVWASRLTGERVYCGRCGGVHAYDGACAG